MPRWKRADIILRRAIGVVSSPLIGAVKSTLSVVMLAFRTKEVRTKLGEPDQLPTVAETKERIAKEVTLKLRGFKSELKQEFEKGRIGLKAKRDALVSIQRKQRTNLMEQQRNRQIEKSRIRSERFRKGLAAIWDWMTGKRSEIKRQTNWNLRNVSTAIAAKGKR